MTKEQIKEYTARVAQANRTELVVIIYELLLDEIQEGNKQYQAGNTDAGIFTRTSRKSGLSL